MKEQNYWQQFISTGRIEDYLSFKDASKDKTASVNGTANVSGSSRIIGDNPHAGVCEVNRNGY